MPRTFRFGVVTTYMPSHTAWITTARRAEELGYSTLFIPDRTTVGIPAPIPALTSAAEATTVLRVGSYVFANGYRHPVLLAREAATLDLLSEGRFELGLGAGVSSDEFQQMGLPFLSAGARVNQLEETLRLVKLLFTEETVNFSGKYYTVTGLRGKIRPVQQPYPPFLVAGSGERMLKLAAREASIIAVGAKISAQGRDASDPPLEQKIAWIKEAAGTRLAELELCQTIYDMEITDSKAELPTQTGTWIVPKKPFRTEQAEEFLLEQRARYGFSYFQIQSAQMENFAPVVQRLAGK